MVKKGGKKPDPTAEELEFIFQRILKQLSDTEILEEMQDSAFPVRSARFIKGRRLHFNAAKKVLETYVDQKQYPLVIEAKRNHFEQLAGIAGELLSYHLKTARPHNQLNWYTKGTYRIHDPHFDVKNVDDKNLRLKLEQNLNHARQSYGADTVRNFVRHFENEFNTGMGFEEYINKQPSEAISRFILLKNRKTFKGTCPVCEGWQ